MQTSLFSKPSHLFPLLSPNPLSGQFCSLAASPISCPVNLTKGGGNQWVNSGAMWSREALSKGLRVDQVSQGRLSGMTMFSSYNVLINDLGIKISLMLMKRSGDAVLGSILSLEVHNVIAEAMGSLDMSRSD